VVQAISVALAPLLARVPPIIEEPPK